MEESNVSPDGECYRAEMVYFAQMDLESIVRSVRSAPFSDKGKATISVMIAGFFHIETTRALGKDVQHDTGEVADMLVRTIAAGFQRTAQRFGPRAKPPSSPEAE